MVRNNFRFALTPAQVVNGVISMGESEGQKIYEHSTRRLTKEGFYFKSEGLFGFIESLKAHGKLEGWGKVN